MTTRWAYNDFCQAKAQYKFYMQKGWVSNHAMHWKKKALEAYYRIQMNRYDALNNEVLYRKYCDLYQELAMMDLKQFKAKGE